MSAIFRFDDDWYVVAQENVNDVIAVQFWHKRGGPSIPADVKPLSDDLVRYLTPMVKYVPTFQVEEELELA